MNELIKWAIERKNAHPQLADEIWEFVSLCQDEIEQGGSPSHEIELCKESIKQLIEQ